MMMAEPSVPQGIIERTTFPSDGLEIDVWIMRPKSAGPVPIVIYNHGSRMRTDGSIATDVSTLSFDTRVWNGVGTGDCAVIFPEGRGYGASAGPKLTDCRDLEDVWTYLRGRARDVVAGIRWLQSRAWADTSGIIVCGCSHGGIVSLLVQADMTVSGTVLQAPAVGDQARAAVRPDLVQALDRSAAPILLQHAEHDLQAPIEFSQSLHDTGRRLGKDSRLHRYPFQRSIQSHDQFNWENRHIWAGDFDRFVSETLGIDNPLARSADST